MSTSSKIGAPVIEPIIEPIAAHEDSSPGPGAKAARQASPAWNYLGVVPFFLFAVLFLLLPTAWLMVGAFQDTQGHFTLANFRDLLQPSVLDAYWISFKAARFRRQAVVSSGSCLHGRPFRESCLRGFVRR